MAAVVLDFTNVKEGSGFKPKRQPPGDYRGKITKVTQGKAKSSGNLMWTFTVQDVEMVSATYPYRVTLNEEALWKVRELLVAAGLKVPQKRFKVDPEKLIGKEIGMTLEDDEYEGKVKSVIDSVFPASDLDNTDGDTEVDDEDLDDEEDEDEEPAPKRTSTRKKAAPAKRKPAPVEDDDDEDEDLDELDVDEL